MKVKIFTPQKKLYQGEAKEVILPGMDGEFSVLDFHQSFLHCLKAGQIKVKFGRPEEGKQELRFPLKAGLARMDLNELVLLVEK